MKFKGLTKLAMSGVALAAVAATLGTSTYAWYVINPQANVTSVTASTAANGETSVLVSKDGSNFSGKIAFGDADYNGSAGSYKENNKRAAFVPVRPLEKADGTDFYDADTDTTGTASSAYLKFNVWVKSGATGALSVMLSAENTTDTDTNASGKQLPKQYAYQDVADAVSSPASSAITATQSFSVDAINALRTAVFVDDATTGTVYETDKIAYTDAYSASTRYTSLGDVTDSNKKSGKATIIKDDGTTSETSTLSGAHLYYTQVMNELPVSTTDTVTPTSATDITNVTIATANVAVKLTFVIWLEGGDDLCFDACGGQTFEFGLQFAAAA